MLQVPVNLPSVMRFASLVVLAFAAVAFGAPKICPDICIECPYGLSVCGCDALNGALSALSKL